MSKEGGRQPRIWLRLVAGVLFAATVALIYAQFRDVLSLSALAEHEDSLRQHLHSKPVRVALLAALLYVAITGLSLPGSTSLTVLFGWYFGFWRGLLLVSFASTAGATIAFFISRCLLYVPLEAKFGSQLAKFRESLQREGTFYLLSLRLIPVIPFFIVNTIMGLTPIRLSSFWWASQLGMLPSSAIFVYTGSSVPSLKALADQGVAGILTTNTLAALILLGVFPILARFAMKRFSTKASDESRGVIADEKSTIPAQ